MYLKCQTISTMEDRCFKAFCCQEPSVNFPPATTFPCFEQHSMKMMAMQLCILYHPQSLWPAQGNDEFTLHETDLWQCTFSWMKTELGYVANYWLLMPLAVLSLEGVATAFQLEDMAEPHLSWVIFQIKTWSMSV